MSKERVYIVVSHKHTPKAGNKTGAAGGKPTQWELAESIAFVNNLRPKHITMSSAIGDYLNRKMLSGANHGMGDYEQFEAYVRTKYAKQMDELDAAYQSQQAPAPVQDNSAEVFTDEFGNVRVRTVFDPV